MEEELLHQIAWKAYHEIINDKYDGFWEEDAIIEAIKQSSKEYHEAQLKAESQCKCGKELVMQEYCSICDNDE